LRYSAISRSALGERKLAMVRIALVSCVKTKRDSPSPAGDLYVSPLFKALRNYAKTHADAWYVLSAEYGLLHPDRVVAPYERTLNNMAKVERIAWAERVRRDLDKVLQPNSEVILLAGLRYREGIEPFLVTRNCPFVVPLEGLGLGKQLQWLKRAAYDG
jgi:hypothetical protein